MILIFIIKIILLNQHLKKYVSSNGQGKNREFLVSIVVIFNKLNILNNPSINCFFESLINQTYNKFELIIYY